jgi:hypothetical protein
MCLGVKEPKTLPSKGNSTQDKPGGAGSTKMVANLGRDQVLCCWQDAIHIQTPINLTVKGDGLPRIPLNLGTEAHKN